MDTIDRLRDAIHRHTPKGRITHGTAQAQDGPGFVTQSDRGFAAWVGVEDVEKDVEGVAKAFWRMEDLAHGHRDEKGLYAPTAELFDPGYLIDSVQNGAIPAGAELSIPPGCFGRLWEEFKVMGRVQGGRARPRHRGRVCLYDVGSDEGGSDRRPAELELQVDGGKISVRPLPEDPARKAQGLVERTGMTGEEIIKAGGEGLDPELVKFLQAAAGLHPDLADLLETGTMDEALDNAAAESMRKEIELEQRYPKHIRDEIRAAEPACACENVSVGHQPGCAWKAWREQSDGKT